MLLTGNSFDEADDLPRRVPLSRTIPSRTHPWKLRSRRCSPRLSAAAPPAHVFKPSFTPADLDEALEVVRQLDPPGVGCRDLRECLLPVALSPAPTRAPQERKRRPAKNGNGTAQVLQDAIAIVDQHLRAVQNKQHKEIAKAIGRPAEAVQQALDYIRTLDPRPGLQYNKVQAAPDRARCRFRQARRRVAGPDERR